MTLRETQVTLATYPFARFLRTEQDPVTGQPAQVLDWAAYEASSPRPAPVAYQAVILENAYLRLTLLPDLGGRIYECVFKPTGNNEFYRNPVVKPTHWGPPHPPYPAGSNWWLAAGGMEWAFPVEEHGFVFGTKWAYDHTEGDDGSITVGLFSSAATRPYVTIDVTLAPDSAAFLVEPSITNPGQEPFRFKFWANAMLAPGKANAPGPDLRLLFPTREVLVHSSGDPALPAPGQRMSWPLYGGRDVSRLGTWGGYLGFFAPAPVAYSGAYDTAADEGMLRVSAGGPARGAQGIRRRLEEPAARNRVDRRRQRLRGAAQRAHA